MNSKGKRKLSSLLCLLCIALFSMAGCLYLISSPLKAEPEDTWTDSGFLKIGHSLTIRNTDNRLSLLDSKDVLSANGLYYAAWTMGDSEPYENSDGDTVDLYDAQLYLVLGEYKTYEEAGKNMTKWLDAGKSNYEILQEEEVTCGGQAYCLITYNCTGEDNPYNRGLSAFGVSGDNAVCIELTCREKFDQDLRNILISFLNNCTYDNT